MQVNTTWYFDAEHRTNNDFWGALDETDLSSFMKLLMVAANVHHGPQDTDAHYNTMQTVLRQHYSSSSATLSPLFQSNMQRLHKELKVLIDPHEGETTEQAMWRFAKERNESRKKGYKVKKSRYLQLLAEAKQMLGLWALIGFEVTYVSIETDAIKPKLLPLLGKMKFSVMVGETSAKGTGGKILGVDDKLIRSSGCNAIAISVAIFSDEHHRRLLCGIVSISGKLLKWHQTESKQCRSVDGSQAWLLSQIQGAAMSDVAEVFKVLESEIFLEQMDFLSHGDANFVHMTELEVEYENELSAHLGKFALALAKARAKGQAYLFGRPHRSILVLGSEAEANTEMELFYCDHKLADQLQAHSHKTELLMEYHKRSPFRTLAVRQLAAGAQQCQWKPLPVFKDHMSSRTKTIISTKVVEDMNNVMKNKKQGTNWGGRYRRPQTGLCASIQHKLSSNVHHYTDLNVEANNAHSTEVLKESDLCPLTSGSMPFEQVAGSVQKAPYFSPAAEGIGTPTADLHVLRALGPQDRLREVSSTWAGCISESEHSIAFRVSYDNAKLCNLDPDQWFVGLSHYKDSAALVWPVEIANDQSCPFKYVVFQQIKEPYFLPIFSFDGLVAVSISLKSWAWQKKQGVNDTFPCALRFTLDGETVPMLHLLAKKAFFSLPRFYLEAIADKEGCAMSGAVSMFDVQFLLVKHILNVSDEQALEILEHKLQKLQTSSSAFNSELLQVDEAQECLDDGDREDFRKSQARAKEEMVEVENYSKCFREKYTQQRGGAAALKKFAMASYKGSKKMVQAWQLHSSQHVAWPSPPPPPSAPTPSP